MAPRKRRGVGRVKGSQRPVTSPPTSIHAVNTCGFTALADEIYLEIASHIPSVPIPSSIHLQSYPEIRRSRHETFLSLTQTSRSLRRFFWRYLWERIEVREGMKIEDKDGTLKGTRTRTRTAYLSNPADATGHKKYAVELVRQLEIVTIRNPQLAQYVNYLDIFITEYSIETVLAELARCLSLFPNLHTVQIDFVPNPRRRSLGRIFNQAFKDYSYPQIRNVFVMFFSVSFIGSCPQTRRVGFTQGYSMTRSCLQIMQRNCPHLEVLENFGDVFWTPHACILVVNNFLNLRTIQFMILPFSVGGSPSNINVFKKLNHLQTIIMTTPQVHNSWTWSLHDVRAHTHRVKEDWIESAKRILIHIQLRDNFEKTVVVRDYDGYERRILIKPKSLEESFA